MRTTKNIVVLSTLVGAACTSACAVNVYSPPAFSVIDHQAAALRANQTAVQGSIEGGGSPANPETKELSGRAAIAHGVTDWLQLGADVSYGYLTFPEQNVRGTIGDGDTTQFMGHVSAKVPLVRAKSNQGLSANAMIGIGAGRVVDVATVTSFDAGANIGYQTCKLMPTLAMAYYLSAPSDREDISARNDGDESEYQIYQLPQTHGVVTSLGVTLETSRAKCMQDTARLQLVGHIDVWSYGIGDGGEGALRSGLALRYRF